MNAHTRNLMNIIATGFIVLVLLSLSLFWCRLFLFTKNIDKLPAGSFEIIIRPSGLVPGEPAHQQAGPQDRSVSESPGPNELNFRFSQVYVNRNNGIIYGCAIGALWDITAEVYPYRDSNERTYYWYAGKDNKSYVCLDNRSGLIIRHYETSETDNESKYRKAEYFAGPNGISEMAEASLGRFYDPIVTQGWDPNRLTLYDKNTRWFYFIDFVRGSVDKGFQLAQGDDREPIANYGVAGIQKWFNNKGLNVNWIGPQIWNTEKGKWEGQRVFLSEGAQSSDGYRCSGWDVSHTFIPILDKTGQIYIYNTKKKSLMQAGYLPMPQSLYATDQGDKVANPRDVLAYEVWPVYAIQRLPADPNKPPESIDVKYLGMNVACISREGTGMSAAVFDPNGKLVYLGETKSNGISTSEYIYSSTSDEPLVTIFLFLLENLQPLVFEVASYLCGDYFEVSAGHRALFILPNSFLGMLGRGAEGYFLDQQFLALMLLLPSLILSVWLAWKVRKDAKLTGISNRAGKWWMAGTIAFGLPAYITYRLTRHKEVLVSCQNCGKMRRPDMENCHHCGSKWEIPDLTPPSWRICD